MHFQLSLTKSLIFQGTMSFQRPIPCIGSHSDLKRADDSCTGHRELSLAT